jgi:hypothetical protein
MHNVFVPDGAARRIITAARTEARVRVSVALPGEIASAKAPAVVPNLANQESDLLIL